MARQSVSEQASSLVSTVPDLQAQRQTTGGFVSLHRCLDFSSWMVSDVQTATTLLIFISVRQKFFKVKPDVFTAEEKRAWLDKNTDVALGSDAFFPFGDNIERAHKSGVKYVAQPGGSVRDDHVIDTCNKYGMVMSFTGIRLFHH